MALVTMKDILAPARGYAVGAFNVHNMEYVQGVVAAAEAEDAPVILMAGAGMLRYFGMGWISALCRYAASASKVPVAIHLDHSRDFETITAAIQAGFTSVMFDGSHLPYAENMAATRKVVEAAHAVGVSVEAEIGAVGGAEDDIVTLAGLLTEPADAARFAQETGVDALAIAIGNCHGLYKGTPKLDFERLAAIRSMTDCPLVLHGGSDVPEDQVKQAIALGISKYNIGTELKIAFRQGLEQALAASDSYEVPGVLGPARQAVQNLAQEKMRLLGCSGKARTIPIV
ncbi:MAG: class II fructose-bisphosphate aldolase [Firmicutes bacterium]|nr:class II fructose-bisphosphate aldolase [Bacillota bacterium]